MSKAKPLVFSTTILFDKKMKVEFIQFVIALYVVGIFKLPPVYKQKLELIQSDWIGEIVSKLQSKIPHTKDTFKLLYDALWDKLSPQHLCRIYEYGGIDFFLEDLDTPNSDQDSDYKNLGKVKIPVDFTLALQEAINVEYAKLEKLQAKEKKNRNKDPLELFSTKEREILIQAGRVLGLDPKELVARKA